MNFLYNDEADLDEVNLKGLSYPKYVEKLAFWFNANWSFGMVYVVGSQGLQHHDAADVMSDAYCMCAMPMRARPKQFNQPMMRTILRNEAISFIRRRKALKRRHEYGNGLISIHDADDWLVPTDCEDDTQSIYHGNQYSFERLLDSIRHRLTPQENLICDKWVKMVKRGIIINEQLPFQFSREERDRFMKGYVNTEANFKDRLHRMRRKIEAIARKFGDCGDDFLAS